MKTFFVKVTLLLGLLILFVANAIAQNIDTIGEEQYIIFLLKRYCPYTDANPIWQDDANEVNAIFIQVIDNFNKYTDKEKHNLRIEAFVLLYENSTAIFEDATDIDRMARRRSLCYMTLSLLSDEYKYNSFIKDAMNNILNIHKEFQYREKLLISLLEILLLNSFNNANTSEMEEKWTNLCDIFNAGKDFLNEDFADNFSILIQKQKQNQTERKH